MSSDMVDLVASDYETAILKFAVFLGVRVDLETRNRQKGPSREKVGVSRAYGATAQCPTRILTPDSSWMPRDYPYGGGYPAKRSFVVEVGYPEDETYLAKKIRLWMQETVSYVFVFECDRFNPVVRLQLWEPGHALRSAADAAPVKTGEIVDRKGEEEGEFEVEGATIEILWVLIAERGGIDSRGDREKMVITGDAIYKATKDVWEYFDECRRFPAWKKGSTSCGKALMDDLFASLRLADGGLLNRDTSVSMLSVDLPSPRRSHKTMNRQALLSLVTSRTKEGVNEV
ncbi:acetylornithine aminotransferase [Ascosphaera pollenicola]|nr:acetylornithine aminotransferase [Ascosphaera pollenicola]